MRNPFRYFNSSPEVIRRTGNIVPLPQVGGLHHSFVRI
jgi:hypothetical protein